MPTVTLTSYGFEVLGHEVGHTWQNNTGGPNYVGGALVAQGLDTLGTQLGMPNLGSGYDVRPAFADGLIFDQMNPEQQATLIEVVGITMNTGTNPTMTLANFNAAAAPFSFQVSQTEFTNVIQPLTADLAN